MKKRKQAKTKKGGQQLKHRNNEADCKRRAEILTPKEAQELIDSWNKIFPTTLSSKLTAEEFDRLKAEKEIEEKINKHVKYKKISTDGQCPYCRQHNPSCAYCGGLGYIPSTEINKSGQSDHYGGIEKPSECDPRDVSENFYTARRENGKFGSYPSSESYDDESNP